MRLQEQWLWQISFPFFPPRSRYSLYDCNRREEPSKQARFGGPFSWTRIIDEDEYEALLNEIDRLDSRLDAHQLNSGDRPLVEQLRDDDGIRVPGAYRVRPVDVE